MSIFGIFLWCSYSVEGYGPSLIFSPLMNGENSSGCFEVLHLSWRLTVVASLETFSSVEPLMFLLMHVPRVVARLFLAAGG